MAYSTTVPQAAQRINETQPIIANNFAVIQTAFSVNHTAMTDAAGQGFHNFLTMPEQVGAPGTVANQGAIYAAVGATSNATELYFERESSSAQIPMTETRTVGGNGWTYLPSGLMIQYGQFSTTWATGTNQTVTFPRNFPATCYSVILTPLRDAATHSDVVELRTITNANFTVSSSAVSVATDFFVQWIAIGV